MMSTFDIETIPAEGADVTVGVGKVKLNREVFKVFLDKIYKLSQK